MLIFINKRKMQKKINYFSRNFAEYRQDLVDIVRAYYSDVLTDFNDSSIGMMLIDLNAAIGDNLSFHIDNKFNETQLDYAKERASLLSLARTYGLKVPGKRPSVAIVDFSVDVPVNGDTFDISYCPIIKQGFQVIGNGQVFETINDIDFSLAFAVGGFPNRTIIPNVDANNNIISYRITKREIVRNGASKVAKRIILAEDVRPFFEFILPDQDVLSIESVILLPGTDYSEVPSDSDFSNFNNKYYEVDSLAENKIYVIDEITGYDNTNTPYGKFLEINNRFISEYTDNGFLKLIFGGGFTDVENFCDFDIAPSLVNIYSNMINNMSLGNMLQPNTTLFVKYKVGGGENSNIGPNTINGVGEGVIVVNGANNGLNVQVSQSLIVNNVSPAIGGKEQPTIEELRNYIKYNFSSQNRCVTIKDYKSRIMLMPGLFGSPYRHNVLEEQNKIKVYVLSLNENNKLSSSVSDALKQNITEYLSDYRMINDYISVENGKIINLGFEIDLFVDKRLPNTNVVNNTILNVSEYFDIRNNDMGQNVYLSDLVEEINNIPGVLNVIDIRVYNKYGGQYSFDETLQPYINEQTRQIDLLNKFTLFAEPNSMYEILLPEKDIKVRFIN